MVQAMKLVSILFLTLTVFLSYALAACPDGYALVPGNTKMGTQNFCVMKYEAKAFNDANANGLIDAGEINLNGCDQSGKECGLGVWDEKIRTWTPTRPSHDWGLAEHTPVSVSEGVPWRNITRNDAITACKSLGPKYDLISNREWQTVAQNMEMQADNWSGNAVGVGCIYRGNNGYNNDYSPTDCSYDAHGKYESGPGKRPAQLVLSTGEEIFHFSGNILEWVKDDYSSKGLTNDYVQAVNSLDFGPQGSYSCNEDNEFCGLGFSWLDDRWNNGGVLRGGASSAWIMGGEFGLGGGGRRGDAGIFAATNIYPPTFSYYFAGFRCVQH